MIKQAVVVSVDGSLATVRADRVSVCDGCHKSSCGKDCAMGTVMGTGRALTATALNKACAGVGDTVELESSDNKVLFYAFAVFILPLVIAASFCYFGSLFGIGAKLSGLLAVVGFVLSFVALYFIDRSKKDKTPDIVVVRIIKRAVDENNITG